MSELFTFHMWEIWSTRLGDDLVEISRFRGFNSPYRCNRLAFEPKFE